MRDLLPDLRQGMARGSRAQEAIDRCAAALLAEGPAFTRRNLLYAVRRELGPALPEEVLGEALRKRRARGRLPGLLPTRVRWRPRRLMREWDAYFPKAVLMVDRPAILDLFVAFGAVATARLAVVCLDGSPSTIVKWLQRGFKAGRRVPFVYLHDSASVVFPFTLEPLATLVRHRGQGELVYRDLGLPPLGANARRFDEPAMPADEPIVDLEALPPATLVRFATSAAQRLVPLDYNMMPLTHDIGHGRQEQPRT